MTPLQYSIWIAATACIVCLIVAHLTGSRVWQRGRDVLLVISCGIDSSIFFYTRHYWMGLAYAIPVALQGQALYASARKRK